jgi:L-Ala-D/L-Glu epimerase
MLRKLVIRPERLPLRAPFRISRGLKTFTDVVVVELQVGDDLGRAECVPYPRYGETTESVVAQLQPLVEQFAAGAAADTLAVSLPAGAARNAIDCAAWDLRARTSGRSVADMLGRPAPGVLAAAVTISLDTPENMRAAAGRSADAPLLKVKLDAEAPHERLAAVAEAAPGAELIVDPNESWTPAILDDMADAMRRHRVVLVEQPLPADEDAALMGLDYSVPICADEAIHTSDDLEQVLGKYGVVNIKLDKTGGLTEAVRLLQRAREMGLGVMSGCMICSSWSIAPALHIAAQADIVDLDGPWWLTDDRVGGCTYRGGLLEPPAPGFWGDAGSTRSERRATIGTGLGGA